MGRRLHRLSLHSPLHHAHHHHSLLRGETITSNDFHKEIFRRRRGKEFVYGNNVYTVVAYGYCFMRQLVHSPPDHLFCLLQVTGGSVDATRGIRIDGTKLRHDLKAELVACGVGLKVGTVGHISLALAPEICFDVTARNAQKRTEDMSVDCPYARHAVESCAAHKIHQHGFHIIVAMVSHDNGFCANVLPQSFEIAISEVACSSLYALFVQFGIPTRIEMHTM